jgi:hypothetical protein
MELGVFLAPKGQRLWWSSVPTGLVAEEKRQESRLRRAYVSGV